jgi:hypothetical protein
VRRQGLAPGREAPPRLLHRRVGVRKPGYFKKSKCQGNLHNDGVFLLTQESVVEKMLGLLQ